MKIVKVTHNEYVGQVIIDTGLDLDTMYDIVESVLDFTVHGWEDIPGTTEYIFDVDLSMMDDWEPTDPKYQAEVARIGQSIVNILTSQIPEPVTPNEEIWDEYDLGCVIMDSMNEGKTHDETMELIYDLLISEYNTEDNLWDWLSNSYWGVCEMFEEQLAEEESQVA